MARPAKSVNLLFLFLLLLLVFLSMSMTVMTEGRPLAASSLDGNVTGRVGLIPEELSTREARNSGPKPGSRGRSFKQLQILGGIKDSGPSPGEGHGYVNGGNQ
ncbi:hypothetical protein BT93_G0012 [Corymbia citriodora subsp. variegata]|nr:hypothetical protein BT93_G0012 [Corymbia citriodora subsp. variegata]